MLIYSTTKPNSSSFTVEKYKGQTAENISKTIQNVPKVESANSLDNLDCKYIRRTF